jgi:hypothetical protein
MTTIYIVTCATGSYDDYTVSNMCARADHGHAEAMAKFYRERDERIAENMPKLRHFYDGWMAANPFKMEPQPTHPQSVQSKMKLKSPEHKECQRAMQRFHEERARIGAINHARQNQQHEDCKQASMVYLLEVLRAPAEDVQFYQLPAYSGRHEIGDYDIEELDLA